MNVQQALNRYFELNPDKLQTMATPNPADTATPSNPTIKVTLRNVYGEEKIYPACVQAEAFAEIANQKTLTYSQIKLIKKLGFTVEIVNSRSEQYL